MVFHWSLSDNKSPQVFMTLLSIWLFSIMLSFGWSPRALQLSSPPFL